MKHAEIRSMLGSQISNLIAQPGDLPMSLRPFQIETLESTALWLLDPNGTRRAYINHATGLGKTVVFASMVASASGMRSLVVVPTKTLLEQTARVIAKFTGGMLGHQSSLASIQDHDGETVAVRGMNHSAVVLTTDASFNKLATKIRQEFDPHLIIRDECHWGYIGPALAALEQFPEAVIIGFSATPDYLTNTPKGGYVPVKLENGQTLYGPLDRFADTHFQTCLDRRSVRWGIENGWLCPLAWGMIEFDMSLKNVPVVEGPNGPDYDEAKLQELMSKHWSIMCETVRRLYDNPDYDLGSRQAYAICPSVDAAEELARAIGSLGLSAACITGNTPDMERNIILRAYNDHEIRFLSSVMVLREGWDAPDAEVCMMLRPTKSRVLYEQGMGRALRLPENNVHKVALVLDAHFQAPEFSPLSAPAIFGKPGEEIPIGGMLIGNGGGARGGEGIESPYLPKYAEPQLVVVEIYEETIERRIRRGAFFEIEGVLWGAVTGMAKHFGLSQFALAPRLEGLEYKWMLTLTGIKTRFYRVEEAREACVDLMNRPRADKNGILWHEDKEYRSCTSYAKSIGVYEKSILDRVAKSDLLGIEGRDGSGRPATLYSIEDLDRVCDDMKKLSSVVRSDGVFEHEGREWASMSALSHLFRISRCAIQNRMIGVAVSSVMAKDCQGKPKKMYAVDEVRLLCIDLISSELVSFKGTEGTVDEGEETVALTREIAKLLGLKHFAVRQRIVSANLQAISAKGRCGHKAKAYRLSEVAYVCKDLLEELPISSSDLTIEQDGLTYMTTNKLGVRLGVSRTVLVMGIFPDRVRWIWGRTPTMQKARFYSLQDAERAIKERKSCRDLPTVSNS